MKENRIVSGFFWRFIERIGRQGIALIVYIVLARLLTPEDYGQLAILQAFISVAGVLIDGGWSSSLIQGKNIREEDFSSILYISLGISSVFYIIIFIIAPYVSLFYGNNELTYPLRVIALILFFYTFNSIQEAWCFRNFAYKKLCFIQLGAVIFSGVIAIIMAYNGCGIWALVVNTVSSTIFIGVGLQLSISWYPKLTFSYKRVKILFSYGWKIMCSNLLNRLYTEISVFLFGKKYSSETLGYYDQGKKYPTVAYDVFASGILSVLFSALSRVQDDHKEFLYLFRKAVSIGSYIIIPCMVGFALVGKSMIQVLLTEKWLPAVPYLQVFCFYYLISILATMILQAINAIGRSDLSLRLNIIQKIIGLILILVFIFCFREPIMVAYAILITSIITLLTNLVIGQRYISYSCRNFLFDIFPTIILSTIMGICIIIVDYFLENSLLCLIIQIIVGIIIYMILSIITKNKNWKYCLELIFSLIKK